MQEHSAGGVVISKGKVLLLKKYYGDWVLPKGKMEKNETTDITALREVNEETGIKAKIVKKIGYAKYYYRNPYNEAVSKRVDYFLMKFIGGDLIPQKEEGFTAVDFIEYDKAIELLKHDSEKNMVKMGMKFFNELENF